MGMARELSGRASRPAKVLIVTLALLCGGLASGCHPQRRDQASASGDSGTPRRLGPVPSAATIEFSLVLRSRQRALARFFDQLDDPRSSRHPHHLSAAAFGARFGPSEHAMAVLR